MSSKGATLRAVTLACASASALWPGNINLAIRAGQVARFLADAGEAERIGRRALQVLSTSPAGMRRLTALASAAPAKQAAPNDTDLIRALEDLQNCLEAAGLKPFLTFGTLLGCVREGRLLPGDNDLDMGILGLDQLAMAEEALEASNRLRITRRRRTEGALRKLEVKHQIGCPIDLKAFWSEAGGFAWFSYNVRMAFKRHYPGPIGLKRETLHGVEVFVPEEAEALLAWHYGDWRTPDPGYHRLTSGPIRSAEQREWIKCCAPLAVLKSIKEDGLKKSLLMVRSAGDLFPEDRLWPDLSRAMEAALAGQGRDR